MIRKVSISTAQGCVTIYHNRLRIAAYHNDREIGYLKFSPPPGEPEGKPILTEMHVQEEFRREGVSTKMAIAAENVFGDYAIENNFSQATAAFWANFLSPHNCQHLIFEGSGL